MFGKPRRFGFGPFGGSNGIVATPEQEAESARVAAMFGMGAENDAPQMQQPSLDGAFGIGGKIMPQQQAAPKRGGLFGNLGKIQGAMGGIGDVLDDSPSGMQARELDYRQQQDRSRAFAQQQQAEAENRQWYEREDYKRKNAPPKDPYRWRNNDGDLMELGADGQPRKAYDDPTEKIDWIQVKDPVSGAISIIPRPRGGGMGDAPDTLPADFDFGGGGASNGTSGFREAFAEWN